VGQAALVTRGANRAAAALRAEPSLLPSRETGSAAISVIEHDRQLLLEFANLRVRSAQGSIQGSNLYATQRASEQLKPHS
jgi:hypothetical protein